MIKTIDGGAQVDIQVGDWVKVQENVFDPDPASGLLFKVLELQGTYCMVNVLVPSTSEYAPSGLSYESIVDNFRKVPFES